MATNSIESFLNITRDTFLHTIPLYNLEGIAIPFNDYPTLMDVPHQACLVQCIKATCPNCRQFFSGRNVKRITPVSNTITQDAPLNDSDLQDVTAPLGQIDVSMQLAV